VMMMVSYIGYMYADTATRETVELVRRMSAAGADAVLVITPCFYKNAMNADALYRHYHSVGQAGAITLSTLHLHLHRPSVVSYCTTRLLLLYIAPAISVTLHGHYSLCMLSSLYSSSLVYNNSFSPLLACLYSQLNSRRYVTVYTAESHNKTTSPFHICDNLVRCHPVATYLWQQQQLQQQQDNCEVRATISCRINNLPIV